MGRKRFEGTPEEFKAHRREIHRASGKRCYDPAKALVKNLRFREQNPNYSREWYKKNKEEHCARTRANHKAKYVSHPEGRPGSARYEARMSGFRSGFERTLDIQLKRSGIKYTYETLQLPYSIDYVYNPDFILSNGIIIEAKGVLDKETRRKMVAVKKTYPELDIRFCFMFADKTVPGLKSTHGEWATKNGYTWSDGRIPESWLLE